MTKARMTLRKLSAGILQMDAEKMAFADSSFDYIWSWGVIHHSADTKRVLQEMNRVLRPNGRCTVMVYYRSWWHFYACGFLRGVFQKRFGTHGNLHHVTQSATDGAIARYYSSADWRDMCRGLFNVDSTEIFGQKSELFPVPAGRLKEYLERMMPDNIGGVMTNTLRMGSFLVAQLHKA
jgi:SAM-dependent methyltransferase